MAPHENDGGSKGIKSVEKSLQILEEIRRQHGARITEIATALDMSRSTIHHYLSTFKEKGYVNKKDEEYHLGIKFLSLGGEAVRTNELLATGTRTVNELAEETGLTARIAIEENGYIVRIYEAHGGAARESAVEIGSKVTTWRSAIGKAMLSSLPDDTKEQVLANMPDDRPDEETLEETLAAVRERGVAFDDHEDAKGAIAAPITSINDDLIGAISLAGPRERIDDEATDLAERVSTTAEVLRIDTTYDSWMKSE